MVCPFCYGWNEADAAECLHCGRSLTSTPEDRRRRKAETASEPLILPEESPARRSTPSAVLVAVGIAAVLICAAVLALPRLVHRNRAPRAPHIVSQPGAQAGLTPAGR